MGKIGKDKGEKLLAEDTQTTHRSWEQPLWEWLGGTIGNTEWGRFCVGSVFSSGGGRCGGWVWVLVGGGLVGRVAEELGGWLCCLGGFVGGLMEKTEGRDGGGSVCFVCGWLL